jgi:hypothetical protein
MYSPLLRGLLLIDTGPSVLAPDGYDGLQEKPLKFVTRLTLAKMCLSREIDVSYERHALLTLAYLTTTKPMSLGA